MFCKHRKFWEIGIKSSIGRIDLNSSLENIFEIFENSGFEILPITPQHILKNATLEFHHQDPFDRIMIAQAMVENLTMLSKDNQFENYNVPIIW